MGQNINPYIMQDMLNFIVRSPLAETKCIRWPNSIYGSSAISFWKLEFYRYMMICSLACTCRFVYIGENLMQNVGKIFRKLVTLFTIIMWQV